MTFPNTHASRSPIPRSLLISPIEYAYCVNLIRIEQNVEAQEEAYEKLDQAILTTRLSALQTSFSPMERRAMLRAAVKIVNFFRERAPVVASAYGLTYPAELEGLMCDRLDTLARDAR